MKVHHSDLESQGWINTLSSLPESNVRVKVASVHIHDWNLEEILYESIGSISPSGCWRVKASESATKSNVFTYKVTYWKPI